MARKAKGELTADNRRFIDDYLVDLNGTRAYRVTYPGANYSTARTESGKLLAKPHIRAEVRAAQADRRRRTNVGGDKVVRELSRIAFADVADLFDEGGRLLPIRRVPLETRRAIAGVKVKRVMEGFQQVEVIDIKFCDKLGALEKLCRHLGLTQEISPLDVLLSSLPDGLAADIRAAMAAKAGGK